jgi:hypothetical protein
MGIVELLGGYSPHPAVPHVFVRVTPSRDVFKLAFKCKLCGETLDWVCNTAQRVGNRVDTWAAMHQHREG